MIRNKSKAPFFPFWQSFTTEVGYFWQTSSHICGYCLLIMNKMHECKLQFLGPFRVFQVWTGFFQSRATKGNPNQGQENHFRRSIHCQVLSILNGPLQSETIFFIINYILSIGKNLSESTKPYSIREVYFFSWTTWNNVFKSYDL